MKRLLVLSTVLLLSIPGCGYKKTTQKPRHTDDFTQVDIPTGQSSRYDDEVDEFAYDNNSSVAVNDGQANDFTWVAQAGDSKFSTVYFDFDSFKIREDQEDALDRNIQVALETIADCENLGKELPTIVVEGHASPEGSSAYNLALSEKRAKALRDRLVAAGVPANLIKIVGRGKEMPVLANNSDRQANWVNRRDEIRLIYS